MVTGPEGVPRPSSAGTDRAAPGWTDSIAAG
jgi:hypothetical protein